MLHARADLILPFGEEVSFYETFGAGLWHRSIPHEGGTEVRRRTKKTTTRRKKGIPKKDYWPDQDERVSHPFSKSEWRAVQRVFLSYPISPLRREQQLLLLLRASSWARSPCTYTYDSHEEGGAARKVLLCTNVVGFTRESSPAICPIRNPP